MFWPMFLLALAFCSVAVLGVLAVRVGVEVRRFSRAVGDSAERITLAAEDLERSALPLASRAGTTVGSGDAPSSGGQRLRDGTADSRAAQDEPGSSPS